MEHEEGEKATNNTSRFVVERRRQENEAKASKAQHTGGFSLGCLFQGE